MSISRLLTRKTRREFKDLTEVLSYQAEYSPSKPFIIFGQKRITFKELDFSAGRLAAFLSLQGVAKGDRVCLWMYNCPEFVISYFAILKLGATVVPINNMFKREEAKYIIEDAECGVLLFSPEKIEDCLNLNLRVASLDKIISFSFSKEVYPEVADLYEAIDNNEVLGEKAEIDPDDLAEILYTSGTTGKPKGACLSHKNLISNVEDCRVIIRATAKDTFICFLPLFHSFASTVCMLFPLYVGSSTVIFRAIRPFKRVLRSIRKNRITIFVGVPSIYSLLKDMKLPWILTTLLRPLFIPLRVCISGAAALPVNVAPVFERKLKVPLLEGYGLTETSPVATLNPLRGERKPGSIGLALPSVELKVVNRSGEPLERGEIGELLIKGPNVMKGYFKMEQASAEVIEKGFLHTGDLARIDNQGYVYIEGRIKEMINVRGLNVYPKEIEDVLYQLTFVKEAAVVGVNHPKKGEVPIGFVVLKDNQTSDSGQILKFLREHLAPFKVPLRIEFRDNLPKNTTGKILKYVLKQQLEAALFSR
ncbi:MAG: long-chain fatty acid--CoA ligase [Candidatus Omnitrophica bacterium]|nr:long-chain fatty acid--CoA ligase [Candidatus Omnitrophota bacterium]